MNREGERERTDREGERDRWEESKGAGRER